MKSKTLDSVIKSAPDPKRAGKIFKLLEANLTPLSKVSDEDARIMAALFSGSEVLSGMVVAHPEWLSLLSAENLQFFRRKQGLSHEIQAWLKPTLESRDYAGAFKNFANSSSAKCCAHCGASRICRPRWSLRPRLSQADF